MRHRHRSPKTWGSPPRSRRAREEASPPYGAREILKEIWSDGWERPAWARTCRKFGWITSGQFYAIEPVRTGRSFIPAFYSDRPFLQMLRKETSFGIGTK